MRCSRTGSAERQYAPRERAGLRDRRLDALGRVRQGTQKLRRQMGHVSREDDDAFRVREPERGGDADDRGACLAAVVQHREGKLEAVGGLADDDHVLEDLTEHAMPAHGQRLPLVGGQRLRRAEAGARPADEERPGYVRHPGGEDELEPGDLVGFPEGPAGAHKVTNRTDETVRIMILSTKGGPGVAVYPDSDKVGVFTEDGADDVMVRRESDVDYWDREL